MLQQNLIPRPQARSGKPYMTIICKLRAPGGSPRLSSAVAPKPSLPGIQKRRVSPERQSNSNLYTSLFYPLLLSDGKDSGHDTLIATSVSGKPSTINCRASFRPSIGTSGFQRTRAHTRTLSRIDLKRLIYFSTTVKCGGESGWYTGMPFSPVDIQVYPFHLLISRCIMFCS